MQMMSLDFGRITADRPYPAWLTAALRSDHAGEAGAVEIYRGALAARRSDLPTNSILRHQANEQWHLDAIERVLPAEDRSILIPVWRAAGWLLGFLAASAGPNTYHHTIAAVESFVDRHYQQQIDALEGSGEHPDLLTLLRICHADEVMHRDEAAMDAGTLVRPGGLRTWVGIVRGGSAIAVALAKRV